MGIVRLGADGSVEVLERSTPEEAARAQEGLLNLARALGRLAAARDFDAARPRGAAAAEADEIDP
ncbi:hypothetical protein GCM10010203_19220 [Actinomadura yumaensis]|jgi:hypothetical protein